MFDIKDGDSLAWISLEENGLICLVRERQGIGSSARFL